MDFLEAGDWRLEAGRGTQCEGLDDFFGGDEGDPKTAPYPLSGLREVRYFAAPAEWYNHAVIPAEMRPAKSSGTSHNVPCFTLPRTVSATSFAASSDQGCILRWSLGATYSFSRGSAGEVGAREVPRGCSVRGPSSDCDGSTLTMLPSIRKTCPLVVRNARPSVPQRIKRNA